MQKLTIQFHLILAALLCGVGPTAGADFEQGLAAFDRGNYAQALREWEMAYPAMGDADAARFDKIACNHRCRDRLVIGISSNTRRAHKTD